jgi:Domain of unknown function (DUF3303)
MLYMAIERFKENAAPEIYRRFRENGRMMPKVWITFRVGSNWISKLAVNSRKQKISSCSIGGSRIGAFD